MAKHTRVLIDAAVEEKKQRRHLTVLHHSICSTVIE
jgi:hypothetical protein